jgi:hypothetical protein
MSVQLTHTSGSDANDWRYCDICSGLRVARWRGKTLEGLTVHTCEMCIYVLSPNQDKAERISGVPESVPCEWAGTFGNGTTTSQEGYLLYAHNVECECGRVFNKLVAKKDGTAYIPQHKTVAEVNV